MKFKYTLFLAVMAFVACKDNPPSEPGIDEVTYDCQSDKAQFVAVDSLVAVMQTIDAWGDDASLDSISNLNDSIEQRLKRLLNCAAVETLDLNTASFENLYYAQTPDGRIRNFHWYANNGGTWQEMRRIYQYYPQPHVAKVTEVDYFAGATRFFKLKSDEPMYLGMGLDKTCSTCIIEYADLFSFHTDTLRTENIATMESRMGDLVTFEFDTTTQSLNYVMIVDDMNEDWTKDMPKQKFKDMNIELGDEYEGFEPEPDAEVVVGSFVFDGKKFVKK